MYAAVALKQMSEMAETVWLGIVGWRTGPRFSEGDPGRNRAVWSYRPQEVQACLCLHEADGLGNTLLMDDAGIPGVLSMPYFWIL